jgi:outer membrane protein insertion porin family
MIAFLLHSCKIATIVKKYPVNEPFVFKTSISVKDTNMSKNNKVELEDNLYAQLEDSLKSREVDKVFWGVMKKPARLDSMAISNSLEFMHNYLHSQGYFSDSMHFTTEVKPVENQLRTHIKFFIWPGKLTRIDSLAYSMRYDSLQAIADRFAQRSLIKKGSPFAVSAISAEMDRLVDRYKNNGYLRFSRDLIYALWDTLDISLLTPSLDPFEQIEQLERIKQRRLNPKANVDIRLSPITDSSKIKKYYVGNIWVYPDVNADSTGRKRKEDVFGDITVVQHYKKFKPQIFTPNIYFKRGELYDQRKYIKTLNRLNTLGSWRLVDIQQNPREKEGQDTVDFLVKLTPAKKYNFTTNFETGYNQSALAGNFLGWGVNFGVQNRNFLRGANLASSNLRYGVEFNLGQGSFVQTQQISLRNSVSYPRFIFPGHRNFETKFPGTIQSVLTLNGAKTDRNFLFNLTTINSSWGYEFSWVPENNFRNQKSYYLGVRIPNIEYSNLIKKDSLDKLINNNPSIKNIFTDGFISSGIINFSMPWSSRSRRVVNVVRANLEESGLLTGLISNEFLDRQLYRFLKVDAEYGRLFKMANGSSFVMRGFAGIGYEFDFTKNPDKRSQLPFFKQYYSGGPNSMRAWQLRRLGPGSIVHSFIRDSASIPDRFGDLQLELNLEYRTELFKLAGFPINGAVFTDMGNVWLLKKAAGTEEEIFGFSKLGKDIAIGAGAGVRIDFGFFVIRFDYGYKVKDPSPSPENAAYQNKFFAYPLFKGSQLQIGIGYPFIF